MDDNVDDSVELRNKEIFYIIIGKELEEEQNAHSESAPPKITCKEASKNLENLINFVQQSEDFNESDYCMLNELSIRINKIKESHKIQANITEYLESVRLPV